MPEYLAPGVFIEEQPGRRTIEGVSTSTAGFVGMTERGPVEGLPKLVTSFGQFQRTFGGYLPIRANGVGELGHLPLAVKQFFDNGGKRAYISRVYRAQSGVDADKRQLALQTGVVARLRSNAVVDNGSAANQTIMLTTLRGFDYAGATPVLSKEAGNATGPPPDLRDARPSGNRVDLAPKLTPGQGEHLSSSAFVTLQPPGAAGPTLTATEPGAWGERVRIQVRPSGGPPVEQTGGSPNTVEVRSPTQFYRGCVIEVRRVFVNGAQAGVMDAVGYATVSGVSGNTLSLDAPATALPPAAADTRREVSVCEVTVQIELGATVETFSGSWRVLDPANLPAGWTGEQARDFNRAHSVWMKLNGDSSLPDHRRTRASKLVRAPSQPSDASYAAFNAADPLASHPSTLNGHPQFLAAAAGVTSPDALPEVLDFLGAAGAGPGERSGIAALQDEDGISIVAAPGITSPAVQAALIAHAEQMKYRVAVLDGPKGAEVEGIRGHRGNFDSKYAALYYPWVSTTNPLDSGGEQMFVPPSGSTVGIYARSDVERGVHKAPANEIVRNAIDVETRISTGEQEVLNPEGINVIRDFRDANRGIRVWGARTISSDPEWKYLNVRRLFIYIEHSVFKSTQWVVFEPNNEELWASVKSTIETFLETVWRDGALLGTKKEHAFYVKCDRSTMSQDDLDNGKLIVEIGIAPTKPAEFVIFRIGQFTADTPS